MLGHLSDIRFLAGVALGSIIFDYIYWTFGFLRMGTTGTTAFAVGRGDTPEVYRVLYRSLALAAALAVAIVLLQWPLRELGFALLSGTPGVEEAGQAYYDARIWGAPATLCNFALVGWLLGREQVRQVLLMTIAANVANIVLNYVFIVRLGLAAYGAGLATMLSQYLMLAVGVGVFLAGGRPRAVAWDEVLDRGRLGTLFRLNRDIFLRTFLLVSAFGLFVNVSSIMGVAVLATNSILLRLLSIASYMIDGAAFASESLAGIFRGSRNLPALRALFRLSLYVGAGCAALVLVVFFAGSDFWLGVLTSHDALIVAGLRYAPWLIPTLVFGGLAYMYDGLFLGLTEGRRLRNAMTLSMLGVFLPLCLAALYLRNNDVLWAAMAAFMLARVLTLNRESRAVWRNLEAG